jgi:hypothetical protein
VDTPAGEPLDDLRRRPGTLGDDALLVRSDQALGRRVHDTIVLLHPESDAAPLAIGGGGAALWDAFRTPQTVDRALAALEASDGAAAAARLVIERLVDERLLVPVVTSAVDGTR